MEENLAQEAINSATNCNWNEAIKINLEILESDNEDIDALNRLSRAYFETGKITKAKETSQKVLKISPDNNIAKNSIERYLRGKKDSKNQNESNNASVDFIEEPGKTKITTLINLGSEKVYTSLDAGDEVLFVPHSHKVSVNTLDGKYIGKLTDDLSARVRQTIKSGYKYTIYIKSVKIKCIKIFIKGNVASFPLEVSDSLNEFSS